MALSMALSEAKSIHQSLKELLKTKEPFDKEVDFQRKNLRRRYLNLLLVHPEAKESKDVENHLWMQTSYAFIASYKQRIGTLDRAVQNQLQQHREQQQQQHSRQGNPHHGVVEHRKLVQRFRQFLADEEKFWTQLVLRIFRLFDLHDARPALVALGLLNEAQEVLAEGLEMREGVMHGASGRNHFQFPPEDPTLSFAPTTSAEREGRLATLSKALICLGDIARYREQYNESNGRPRAGHDDAVPARRGRTRRGGGPEIALRPRNYDKAQQCYEQARFLVPYEGNPSHQLAILASYQKDSFASIIHYYRSLCVRQPYDTAAENLGTVLTKSLESWKQKMRRERDKNVAGNQAPSIRVRAELFQERVVALHALWRMGMEKGLEKMKSFSPKHAQKVVEDFVFLVSGLHILSDIISNTVILSQGALWKHRMIRDVPLAHHPRRPEPTAAPEGTASLIEWAILDHILDLHSALLEVGKDELKDPPQMDIAGDLAQRISATFRRTLPALRISSKWLRANFKYLMQDQEFIAMQQKKGKNAQLTKTNANQISSHSAKTIAFWKSYAAFILALSQAFPVAKLPVFDGPLEEDVEMRGFLPLRNLMVDGGKLGEKREQVHPNVEQLMRISDLLDDAEALVKMENCPLLRMNGHIVFNLEAVDGVPPSSSSGTAPTAETALPVRPQTLLENIRNNSLDSHPKLDPDADDMTVSTNPTEDDPVREAFKHVIDDELEEDEVVYMRTSMSPALSPKAFTTPVMISTPLLSPKNLSPRSPIFQHAPNAPGFSLPPPGPPATTAQDLLNNVMGMNMGNRTLNGGVNSSVDFTAVQPQILFGSELSHRPAQSIWSAAQDEQPLMYGANAPSGHNGHVPTRSVNGGHNVGVIGGPAHSSLRVDGGGSVYQTSPHRLSAAADSQDLSHSIWPFSYDTRSASNQRNFVDALPLAPFAQSHNVGLGGGMMHASPPQHQHQRIPSASMQMPPSQIYNTHNVSHVQDPFAYTSPMLHQAAIHRPGPGVSASAGYMGSSLGQGGLPPVVMGGPGAMASNNLNASLLGGNESFYMSSGSGQHSRQISMHDPRVGQQQTYMSPAISQTWGNGG